MLFENLFQTFILIKILFIHVNAVNLTGKSYYFKTNANNEFTVYNRIHFLNHNISDFSANPHGPQNIKVIKKINGVPVAKLPTTKTSLNASNFYLDPEWHYDHKQFNKSDLPYFIKKFYEHRVEEAWKTNPIRILFNSNRNTSSSIIKFNLNSLSPYENVSDADLYFYWPLKNTSSIYKKSVVLRLYQLEYQPEQSGNGSNLLDNPDIHKLFNVIYISKAQKGWQTFKIKKPIDNWAKGEENLGLLLTISDYDENKLISIYNDTNRGAYKTFAVLNIQNNDTDAQPHLEEPETANNVAALTSPTIPPSNKCSKKSWFVDFSQLNWYDFIIHPEEGFMGYQCVGKCHIENHDHQFVNYVKLRHWNNGQGLRERSCCVATKFSSLPIMFFDRFGNVVMKNYEDMVVDECGCR
ncbi:inhibin beta B chain-like [Sitophilus oryzae]|uniref:Inhibin beta B chain-like n=1 Tax=Sitophilus oryzae TaxID=7048 RepID=A0A6J2X322_SITOR|nr:inhibin beta B chain-like [Sitophilus oryzae]